jgi:hypothetical protein
MNRPDMSNSQAVAVKDHALSGASPSASSRVGKVLVAGFFDPSVRRSIKCLAIERGCSQQELLAHALRLLFTQAIEQGSPLVKEMPAGLHPAWQPDSSVAPTTVETALVDQPRT